MADAVKQAPPLVLTPRWDTIRRAEVTPQADGTLKVNSKSYSQVIVAAPFGATLSLEAIAPEAARKRDAALSRQAQEAEKQRIFSEYADTPAALPQALERVEAKVFPPDNKETVATGTPKPSTVRVTIDDPQHRGAKIGLCDGWQLDRSVPEPGQTWNEAKGKYEPGKPFQQYDFPADGSRLTLYADDLSKLTIERDAKYCNPPLAPQPAKAVNK